MRDPKAIDGNEVAAGNDVKPLRFAGLILDLDASTLRRESGEPIELTRGELALLRVFVARPGRVLSRDALLDALGNRRFEPFDRSVDMQVGRLRRKIEPDPKEPCLIVTVPGEGYRFDGLPKTPRSDRKPPIATPAPESDQRWPDEHPESRAPSGQPANVVQLKNISQPVRVYSLEVETGAELKAPQTAPRSRLACRSWFCPSSTSAAIRARNILSTGSRRA
jgi:DNA-binding winged helix-turn-helix (wHTH) protein